ncbi:MAG: type IIA DNA topoisomerase subunit B [Candidatus Brocadiae bacterium]|nr:type IIA DNA topoisomerase subunit B [Candidatus Brocadiia bacterium]
MTENYQEKNIISLDWREHIRFRPGMYIGKLGDGASPDDGIYMMFKEIMDNSIDEHIMGFGKTIDVVVSDYRVSVRDYGRGIPLGKVFDCVAKINTGGKYDSSAFKKSVGLNGVGTKVVNALSGYFMIQATRECKTKVLEFEKGVLKRDHSLKDTQEADGTMVDFIPDREIFKNFNFIAEHLEKQIWNYAFLNTGLSILFNGKKYYSRHGLLDLLSKKTDEESLSYPIIHLKAQDIEIALSHSKNYGEQYYTFVNGQYTPQGGTHQSAFREALVKTVRDFFKKEFDSMDVRSSIVVALSIRVEEPVFESQTKTRLGSQNMSPDGTSIRTYVMDFLKKHLDDYLHKNPDTANALLQRILQSEKERKEIAGIRKLANQRDKKATFYNKKLRDCRYHLDDTNQAKRNESMIFITEGDSASGSLTQARDVDTQAIFSLRGKPLNSYGLTKKIVYANEEFHCLHHALNIEEGIENLRYNYVVIATDADVDGMHIRLLLLTFFLQFFPDLVRNGHLYLLETPLFRVRNKQETIYCYNESKKAQALSKLGKNAEITRFKGLGEISPQEFRRFIQEDIRLTPVIVTEGCSLEKILQYYMGKNTPERQQFIIENLKVEKDLVHDRA